MNTEPRITALGDVTHTQLAGIGSIAIEPIKQHTATPTTTAKLSTQKNFAKLSPELSFINEKGEQEGAYYALIQGHKIRQDNHTLWIYFIHSVVVIQTNDAAGLRRLIYQKQHNEIAVGKDYNGIEIHTITFMDSDSIPMLSN